MKTVLENACELKESRIQKDQDYNYEVRQKSKQLLICIFKARKNRQSTVLVKDKLKINIYLFDYENYLKHFSKASIDEDLNSQRAAVMNLR